MTFVLKSKLFVKKKYFTDKFLVFLVFGVTDGEMQLDMEAALHSVLFIHSLCTKISSEVYFQLKKVCFKNITCLYKYAS